MSLHQEHLQAANTPYTQIKLEQLFTGRQTYAGFRHDAHLLVRSMLMVSTDRIATEDDQLNLARTARHKAETVAKLLISTKSERQLSTTVYVAMDNTARQLLRLFEERGSEHHHKHIRDAVSIQKLPEVPAPPAHTPEKPPVEPHPYD